MFLVDYQKSQRVMTDQGFLKVPGRLARIGIQTYYAFELGITDGDPKRRIRIYRPESVVFDAASMASFEDNPITVEHPSEKVTADNWRALAAGHVRNIRRDGDFLVGDLTITDRAAIKALDDGKVEVSNGYTGHIEYKTGTTPGGEPYDAILTEIRGNHVALVDAARCGSACRVLDSQPKSGAVKMATKKILVDGLPLEFDESAVVVIEKLVSDRDTVTKQVATLQADAAKVVLTAVVDGKSMNLQQLADALTAANVQIVELKKDVMTPDMRDALVADWGKMMADAKVLMPAIETKGKTCAAIRREVVAKLFSDSARKPVIAATLGGATVEAATDDQIKTAFSVLAASAPATQHVNDAVSQALIKDGKAKATEEQPTGRDAYLERNANAWQTK